MTRGTFDLEVQRLRPELRLVLICARTHIDDDAARRGIELAAGDLDWQMVIELARSHGVPGLVLRGLTRVCRERVPPDVLERLRLHVLRDVRHNLLLVHRLGELVRDLRAAAISCVAFKGPTLALSAYGEVGLRSFRDLDVFVRSTDALNAIDVLLDHGWRHREPSGFDPTDVWLRAKYHHALVDAQGVMVEIHWNISPSFVLDVTLGDEWWHRTHGLMMNGQIVQCFALEDQVLLLCIHGGKHLWCRLSWVCDVAEILRRRPALDWNALWERAEELGCQRMVLLGVALSHDLLDAPVPSVIAKRIEADATIAHLRATVVHAIMADVHADVDAMAPAFYYRLKARPIDRFAFLTFIVRSKLRSLGTTLGCRLR